MRGCVFLIGYMGAGKTTLGRALAASPARGGGEPPWRFFDLDEAVEQAYGHPVAEIFATAGEGRFRELEAAALHGLASLGAGTVVACGGGTPCFGDNMHFMLSHGTVVWLDAPVDVLVRRLLEAPAGQRPLVAGKSPDVLRRFVASSLTVREPFYRRAHLRFDASRLDTAEQIAQSLSCFRSLLYTL